MQGIVAMRVDGTPACTPQSGGLWSTASDQKGACSLPHSACAGSVRSLPVGQSGASEKRNHPWALLLLFALLLALLPRTVFAQESGPNRAGLIVVHGDGHVITRCVTFDEAQISGVTLLQRSGLSVLANNGPMGSAVCTVNGEGCPASDCFCQCKNSPCAYWNYFHRNADGSWAYSGMGAVVWMLNDGDVDGWVWGDGSVPPPTLTFDIICGTDTAVAAPPSPATSAPTATPIPPETPIPTPTAPPSATPTTTATTSATSHPTTTPSHSPTPTLPNTSTPTPNTSPTPLPSPINTPTPTSTPLLPHTPTPLLIQYAPFVLLLGVIGGLALIQRKRG